MILNFKVFKPKSLAICQRGRVQVVLADAQALPQCWMEDVEVDQDAFLIAFKLFMPRSFFVFAIEIIFM